MPLAEIERLKARTFPLINQLKSYVELTCRLDTTDTGQKAVGLYKQMSEKALNQKFKKH